MERAGGWYQVSARGNERRDIFYQDLDRRHFLELLQGLVEMFRVRLHGRDRSFSPKILLEHTARRSQWCRIQNLFPIRI
jgi:hypothetical protein